MHEQLNQSECQSCIYVRWRYWTTKLTALRTEPYFFFAALRKQNTQQCLHLGHCNNRQYNTNENALIFFYGLTVIAGRSLIIVEVSLPHIGHAPLGKPPLPGRLPENTRLPHERGDHWNLRSQQASGRLLAGIGNYEPIIWLWPRSVLTWGPTR